MLKFDSVTAILVVFHSQPRTKKLVSQVMIEATFFKIMPIVADMVSGLLCDFDLK